MGGWSLNLEDKLYWARVLAGIAVGALTAILKLYQPTILVGVILLALVYIVSVVILKVVLSEEARAKLGRKLYLSGAAAYVAMWLITLVFVFNVMLQS
ncbi:MAG: hypothetical protein DRN61_01935 [Thaumarchaeota archaeon]|nr:MAG: hypothetical protein DRN61_01935 [Nitrososphaerota archaeon]